MAFWNAKKSSATPVTDSLPSAGSLKDAVNKERSQMREEAEKYAAAQEQLLTETAKKKREVASYGLREFLKTYFSINMMPSTNPINIDGFWLGVEVHDNNNYWTDPRAYSCFLYWPCEKCSKLRQTYAPFDLPLRWDEKIMGTGATVIAKFLEDVNSGSKSLYIGDCNECGPK